MHTTQTGLLLIQLLLSNAHRPIHNTSLLGQNMLHKICMQEYSSPYVQGSYWAHKLSTTYTCTYAASQQTPLTDLPLKMGAQNHTPYQSYTTIKSLLLKLPNLEKESIYYTKWD